MSRLDLVVFGATGFTGKRVVEEIARVSKKYGNLSWAAAGRSQSKLETLIAEVSKKTSQDLSSIKLIIAEVSDEESLKSMCSQAKVVVNCCGPYRLYGEPVVRAAVESKAHYVDVSGEPQFMETMQLKYDAQARENGVYIISACGFDSVPNDMGIMFLQQHFDGTLNSVESYMSFEVDPEYLPEAKKGIIHYGTWESLVYSLAHMGELAPLRKKLYPDRLPTFKPKLQARSVLHKHDGGWCLPFPGADGSVVYRSQRFLYSSGHQRPVQFKPYCKMPSFGTTLLTVIGSLVLYIMSMTSCTRKLLLSHPRLFSFGLVSHEGPTQAVMDHSRFTFQLYGQGWSKGQDVDASKPNKTVVAKVSGADPGYGTTATAVICSAITILKQQDKMSDNGGVLTTGAAFQKTDLVKLLNENNVKFEIVEN